MAEVVEPTDIYWTAWRIRAHAIAAFELQALQIQPELPKSIADSALLMARAAVGWSISGLAVEYALKAIYALERRKLLKYEHDLSVIFKKLGPTTQDLLRACYDEALSGGEIVDSAVLAHQISSLSGNLITFKYDFDSVLASWAKSFEASRYSYEKMPDDGTGQFIRPLFVGSLNAFDKLWRSTPGVPDVAVSGLRSFNGISLE